MTIYQTRYYLEALRK
ncbi:hypothetical protein KTH90_01145 [Lachnospiraceae bacterium ASD4241]|uniref:Uncharacterized protein n=1 Tax=Diplocloster modestus TaxID=2850322 RepID=A0ABS6K183_9FIRM|nr:hypothetical protein [Diplocloster modestus]